MFLMKYQRLNAKGKTGIWAEMSIKGLCIKSHHVRTSVEKKKNNNIYGIKLSQKDIESTLLSHCYNISQIHGFDGPFEHKG